MKNRKLNLICLGGLLVSACSLLASCDFKLNLPLPNITNPTITEIPGGDITTPAENSKPDILNPSNLKEYKLTLKLNNNKTIDLKIKEKETVNLNKIDLGLQKTDNFLGWYFDKDFTNKLEQTVFSLNEDTVLYAKIISISNETFLNNLKEKISTSNLIATNVISPNDMYVLNKDYIEFYSIDFNNFLNKNVLLEPNNKIIKAFYTKKLDSLYLILDTPSGNKNCLLSREDTEKILGTSNWTEFRDFLSQKIEGYLLNETIANFKINSYKDFENYNINYSIINKLGYEETFSMAMENNILKVQGKKILDFNQSGNLNFSENLFIQTLSMKKNYDNVSYLKTILNNKDIDNPSTPLPDENNDLSYFYNLIENKVLNRKDAAFIFGDNSGEISFYKNRFIIKEEKTLRCLEEKISFAENRIGEAIYYNDTKLLYIYDNFNDKYFKLDKVTTKKIISDENWSEFRQEIVNELKIIFDKEDITAFKTIDFLDNDNFTFTFTSKRYGLQNVQLNNDYLIIGNILKIDLRETIPNKIDDTYFDVHTILNDITTTLIEDIKANDDVYLNFNPGATFLDEWELEESYVVTYDETLKLLNPNYYVLIYSNGSEYCEEIKSLISMQIAAFERENKGYPIYFLNGEDYRNNLVKKNFYGQSIQNMIGVNKNNYNELYCSYVPTLLTITNNTVVSVLQGETEIENFFK